MGLTDTVSKADSPKGKGDSGPDLSSLIKAPREAVELYNWPSEEIISSEKRVLADKNIDALRAYRTSIGWIQKVLSKDRLPTDPNYLKNNLIMIEDEYGLIDATHVRWENNNCKIEITQTKTVFSAKLTPLGAVTIADTSAAKKQLVRSKLLELLSEYVDIEKRGPVDSEIVRKNIMPILLKSSVDEANIYDSNNVTYSRCKKPNAEDKEDSLNFRYWWRRVNWWTNGKSIGIYTLKTEGGAWKAGYGSKLDENWFDGVKRERKRSETKLKGMMSEPSSM